ncbi:uncharacterized protein B0I36DRAFT_358930 [Microdochium trichocladiopsis]|uniref:Uncharacterized protein n=1 Tax=Microdochium trichocladiopsis TaxID=1682393 RepID=A0A9P8YFT0_9PEZI|nr:uncharacterized protein B0I36DRAFT_358930 [Microdochium trichocladiopsis]KAH7037194.1 hypothetical protein B0I36DRAFT_358930 [Microdochium trichocladiopsis]
MRLLLLLLPQITNPFTYYKTSLAESTLRFRDDYRILHFKYRVLLQNLSLQQPSLASRSSTRASSHRFSISALAPRASSTETHPLLQHCIPALFTMQLSTLITAALLPAAAFADVVYSTSTSTTTLTHYITLQKVSTSTAFTSYAVNTTSQSYYPTGSWSSASITLPTSTSTTTKGPTTTPSVAPTNGAGVLGTAHVVIAGIAGMAVAAML